MTLSVKISSELLHENINHFLATVHHKGSWSIEEHAWDARTYISRTKYQP